MNSFHERSLPPGYNHKSEITIFVGTLAGIATSSLTSFFRAYTEAKQSLYIRIGTELIRDESKVMPDFAQILGGRLYSMFIFAALAFIIPSAFHFAYHYRGSKSIYLMRRLPKKTELYKRCLLMPLIYLLMFLLATAALLLIYYVVYIYSTPA